MKKIIKSNYFFILIVLLAGLLRFLGQNPGYPDNHPDEGVSFTTSVYMLFHFMEPDMFYYPAGVPLIQVIFYVILFIPVSLIKIFLIDPSLIKTFLSGIFKFFSLHHDLIFGLRNVDAMFWSRYITGSIGLLSVVLIYFVSKKLFNKQVGLFASFFLAVNYRHIVSSHLGLPDIYNGFFSLLSFYFSYILLEKQTKKRYIFAGVSIGAAIAMKFQLFSILPFLIVNIILILKKKKMDVVLSKNILLAIFSSIVTFLIINPYLIKNLKDFLYQADITYKWYQMGIVKLRLYPYFYLFNWGIGKLPFLAMILGIFIMAKKSFIKFILLMSFIIPFFFAMTIYSNGGLYTRNFATVIPFIMIFPGYLMYQAYKSVRGSFWLQFAVILLTVVINVLPFVNSFKFSYYYSRPWNSDVLMDWMGNNLPSNIVLKNSPLNLSWKNRDEFFEILKSKHIEESELSRTHVKGPYSLAEFQDDKVDFVIINDSHLQAVTYRWRVWPNNLFLKYSSVPFAYIQNSFYGLSVSELTGYTVHEIYKPWQALSSNNYLVFKIPKRIENIGNKISKFDFDGEVSWQTRSDFRSTQNNFKRIREDNKNNNWIIAFFGTNQEKWWDRERFVSPPLSIVPNKYYTVTGWIKNTPFGTTPERDGFLRLDFYKDKEDFSKVGEKTAVSQRAFLANKWQQVQASSLAPRDAKYMTISFQRENQVEDFKSYLDNIEVFESDEVSQEPFSKIPYIKATISPEVLYHNTIL